MNTITEIHQQEIGRRLMQVREDQAGGAGPSRYLESSGFITR